MRILLILSTLLFVASCTRSPQEVPSVPTTTGTETQSTSLSGPSYSEAIYSASAKIKNTPEFENCMKPSVNMCLTQVGNDLARKNKSIELCSELPGESTQAACRFGIVMSEASESGSKAACDKLSGDYRESCITSMTMQMARTSGNTSDCDNLTSVSGEIVSRKDQCYTMVITQKPGAVATDCKVIGSDRERSVCESLLSTRPN